MIRHLMALTVLLLAVGVSIAQDMPLSQILLPGEGWTEVKKAGNTVSAMAADRVGNVFVADADGQRILEIDTDGLVRRFANTSDVVGGLAVSADGVVYVSLPAKKQIIRHDRKGFPEVAYDGVPARDLLVRDGRLWFTAPEKKAVFLAGRAEPVATGLRDPLGLALWRKGDTLVVGDAADRYLYVFRVGKDGSLDAREKYYALRVRPRQPSAVRGLVLDSSGRMYAATAEGVQVFDPTGRLSGVLNSPERRPVTAVAFGGEERNHLFIVCGGKVWKRKTQATGAP